MLEFKSADDFHVSGKSYMFIVRNPKITHDMMTKAKGSTIEINGKQYKCLDYTQYALAYKGTEYINYPFGILTTPINQSNKRRERKYS